MALKPGHMPWPGKSNWGPLGSMGRDTLPLSHTGPENYLLNLEIPSFFLHSMLRFSCSIVIYLATPYRETFVHSLIHSFSVLIHSSNVAIHSPMHGIRSLLLHNKWRYPFQLETKHIDYLLVSMAQDSGQSSAGSCVPGTIRSQAWVLFEAQGPLPCSRVCWQVFWCFFFHCHKTHGSVPLLGYQQKVWDF